jgi:hypothetical protein
VLTTLEPTGSILLHGQPHNGILSNPILRTSLSKAIVQGGEAAHNV